MGTKYIIELEDGEHVYKTTLNVFGKPVMRAAEKVVPYMEFDLKEAKEKAYKEGYKAGLDDERDRQPDIEQVRKEAYDKGFEDGKELCPVPEVCHDNAYRKGLSDAWDAARKIIMGDINIITSVFGTASRSIIIRDFTAEKVIERLKAYEQEQEEKKKTNYYFEMMKDAIETSAKEYGMSLDEVAEVIKKMREPAAAQ